MTSCEVCSGTAASSSGKDAIGRLAQRVKVNAGSIRFYERQGLLAPATKTNAGHHLYTDDTVRRIAFISTRDAAVFRSPKSTSFCR